MGDALYACDANGAAVMTRHRGGHKDRVGEARCTEHLDIDYQIPPCCDCAPEPPGRRLNAMFNTPMSNADSGKIERRQFMGGWPSTVVGGSL